MSIQQAMIQCNQMVEAVLQRHNNVMEKLANVMSTCPNKRLARRISRGELEDFITEWEHHGNLPNHVCGMTNCVRHYPQLNRAVKVAILWHRELIRVTNIGKTLLEHLQQLELTIQAEAVRIRGELASIARAEEETQDDSA